GQPFTSYLWPERLAKPVLYPLRTAKGTIITRGYPLEPRPGERADHPHHVGLWLNYESVNGIDFWNNSEAIKPQDAPKMGTIRHQSIVSAIAGADHGGLEVEADWRTYDKRFLFNEHTRYVRPSASTSSSPWSAPPFALTMDWCRMVPIFGASCGLIASELFQKSIPLTLS